MKNGRNDTKFKIDNKTIYLDKDMEKWIVELREKGFNTVASCIGHGKYHLTIFIKDDDGSYYEFFTSLPIKPIKRRYLCFYQKDKNGYYFNQEIENYHKKPNLV